MHLEGKYLMKYLMKNVETSDSGHLKSCKLGTPPENHAPC